LLVRYFFALFLNGCGNSGPSNADVVSAVREYEGMEHKLKMEWNGVNTTLPVKLTYTKVENVSCTMVGDGEAICSVNLEGTSSAVEGMIKKNFSGVEKFHLYKIDGKWKTEDAIKQGSSSAASKPASEFEGKAYQDVRTKIIAEGWEPYIRKGTLIFDSKNPPPFPETQYCNEDVCTNEFINKSKSDKVRRVYYGICSKDRYFQCQDKPVGFLEVSEDDVILKSKSDQQFKSMTE
jgi:hypothetical protein